MASLISTIADLVGDQPDYVAHNIKNTSIFYGVPPVQIKSWQYFSAKYNHRQNGRIMCLSGKGVFLPNRNMSGIIEIGILSATAECASIELLDLSGVAYPLYATDTKAIGSFALGTGCKKISVPEWKRSLLPDLAIYRFEVDRLWISTGVRMSDL